MPGYLSSLFGGDDTQSDQGQQHLGVQDGADLDQTVGVHQSMSGSYTDAQGTTHEFSSTHDVSVTVSAHVLVAAAVDTAEGVGSDG